jgi:hypothetical protein
MTAGQDPLHRIAAALDRLAPPPAPAADPAAGAFFRWDGATLRAVARTDPLPVARFAGIDPQIAAIRRNLASLAAGAPAHDMLLWGARGMGKSAVVRSLAAEAGVALVEAGGNCLPSLPTLFDRLAPVPRPFLLFVDDLAFAAAGPEVRLLRSLLDGGVAARPANVRLAVTSNHRHLLARDALDTADARHARDALDDGLALVDRFGLVLGFHVPDQPTYLEMVRRHLAPDGLAFEEADAIAFALARGGRSGRTAAHYRIERLTRLAIAKDSQ